MKFLDSHPSGMGWFDLRSRRGTVFEGNGVAMVIPGRRQKICCATITKSDGVTLCHGAYLAAWQKYGLLQRVNTTGAPSESTTEQVARHAMRTDRRSSEVNLCGAGAKSAGTLFGCCRGFVPSVVTQRNSEVCAMVARFEMTSQQPGGSDWPGHCSS